MKRVSLHLLIFLSCLLPWLNGCTGKNGKDGPPLFTVLDADRTGLHFSNNLKATPGFNMSRYMYFYNGAGVGAGDLNNDGKIDLFFASNQSDNKLYLNRGNLTFEDVTAAAKVPQDGSWSTGISLADVNGDGLLDIYIRKVGQFEELKGKNQLLVCTGMSPEGVPTYTDRAADYGLDFTGFSTQAAFLDYDLDGDLDLYLLNHSVHQNGTFAERKLFMGTTHPLTGDRIFRNDGSRFTDVTSSTGINSSAIGYGLGIAVSDINFDGYPDIYVGNDFHENDYLYINQKNGTFREELTERMMHTSQFSMGVDVADINNDAQPEIISMDMLPSDPYILKRSLGEDEYNIFHMKLTYGYFPQYARNTLQLNRGNGKFSDVALYAGVFDTDWSWSPLWMDFDNDGLKDLFVSNGIPKRLNDIDYVNYVSNDDVQQRINAKEVDAKEMAIIDRFPQIKLPNKFFRNKGDVVFEDQVNRIEGDRPTFSNGSAYADFDNDGDLDVVVNNIDEPALLYQNRSNDKGDQKFVSLRLQGPATNTFATGAKVLLFTGGEKKLYEQYAVKGFQSSMQVPVHIGLQGAPPDSAVLIWPDNTYQPLSLPGDTPMMTIAYRQGLPAFDYTRLTPAESPKLKTASDITRRSRLLYLHRENPFVEFDREPLIPHMVSREGPALAVGDMNADGLDDVFIGSSKGTRSAVFVQDASGTFRKSAQPELDRDSTWEDTDACWIDVNGDKKTDLVVASGGNEYYGRNEYLMPRVYIQGADGALSRLQGAFTDLYLTASCVQPQDINSDGYPDLFLGGRAVPWEYGTPPPSYLLQNDGKGHFRDVTKQYLPELSSLGMVKDADWCDMDRDGDADLVLAMEWDGIIIFSREKDGFRKHMATEERGWWNCTLPFDADGDGDLDLLAGNLGKNSRLKASDAQPVRMYYQDFDGNGKKEQLLTYYLGERELPFANKGELEKQMPLMKKRFLYAEDFARAPLNELFSREKPDRDKAYTADYFGSALLINEGGFRFRLQELPWQAQLTSLKDAAVVDANGDGLPDLLLGGNFYDNNIQMGRYDADYGSLLLNRGRGQFQYSALKGFSVKGQVRRIRPVGLASGRAFVLARNNDSTLLLRFGSDTISP